MNNKLILTLVTFVLFIYHTDKCFSQWMNLNSGTTQNLRTVCFVDVMTGYAGGENGVIIKTTNNGANWNSLNTGTANDINSIYFYNASTGLACASAGQIIITTNSGANWNIVPSGVTDDLFSISFSGSTNGVCSGNSGTLLYTSNGGSSWTISKKGFFSAFYGIYMVSTSVAYACGVNAIFQPLIAKSTNGGMNWDYNSFYLNGNEGNLRGINFISDTEGFAVSNVFDGQGGVSYTSNSGVDWTTQLFPDWLNDIEFSGINTGYCVGGNGSILKTTDNGVSWNPQPSGVSSELKSVDFIDQINGFAAGDAGTILKTTNGGITAINNTAEIILEGFSLSQNYPNPFNPVTVIHYSVPSNVRGQTSNVRLTVYNSLGKEVATLVNESKPEGNYSIKFDGSNFSSGIYFYRLESGEFRDVKSMILLK